MIFNWGQLCPPEDSWQWREAFLVGIALGAVQATSVWKPGVLLNIPQGTAQPLPQVRASSQCHSYRAGHCPPPRQQWAFCLNLCFEKRSDRLQQLPGTRIHFWRKKEVHSHPQMCPNFKLTQSYSLLFWPRSYSLFSFS